MATSKPINPDVGDIWIDTNTFRSHVYTGNGWERLHARDTEAPSASELKTYPTLKQAWNEYLVIRKLLGL